LPTLI
jgi:hypothetical protein